MSRDILRVVYQIVQPYSAISRLRKRGHNIVTEIKTDLRGRKYARYRLVA